MVLSHSLCFLHSFQETVKEACLNTLQRCDEIGRLTLEVSFAKLGRRFDEY